tara:strand:+ start:3979 stop:4314 length:336 start_codon:yes stop_codon:yes gene_type:complete
MNYTEYIKPFLLGGTLIAGSKYISKYADPKYGSLIAGIPTGIIGSYFILGNNSKKKYYNGYLVSSIMITLSILFINIISRQFPTMGVNKLSLLAILLWITVSFIAIKYEVE